MQSAQREPSQIRLVDADGSYLWLYDQEPGSGVVIEMMPAPILGHSIGAAQFFTQSVVVPADHVNLLIKGPYLDPASLSIGPPQILFSDFGNASGNSLSMSNSGLASIGIARSNTAESAGMNVGTVGFGGGEFSLARDVGLNTTTAKIAADALTYNSRQIFKETAFGPVLSSITGGAAPTGPGNGELSGRYCFISDKRLRVEIYMLGGTIGAGYGAAGNVFGFSLPFTADTDSLKYAVGSVTATDAGVAEYSGICRLNDINTARVILGTNNMGSTTPWAFGANDRVNLSMEYTIP